MDDVTFTLNTAQGSDGGGIARAGDGGGGALAFSTPGAQINDVTFIQNTAHNGGAVLVLNGADNALFEQVTFSMNTSVANDTGNDDFGGGVAVFSDDVIFSGVLFEKNNALNGGCLLYTSPSPRDRQKSRMPSSA